jgi:hypothetical protein
MNKLLTTLAAKTHEHQLVPFLGAGCSLGHVKVDWDGIAQVMSARFQSSSSKSNAEISEDFVVANGHRVLCDLLGEYLLISDEQPTARAERIAAPNKHPLVVPKSYSEIFSELMTALPKQFPTPRE